MESFISNAQLLLDILVINVFAVGGSISILPSKGNGGSGKGNDRDRDNYNDFSLQPGRGNIIMYVCLKYSIWYVCNNIIDNIMYVFIYNIIYLYM